MLTLKLAGNTTIMLNSFVAKALNCKFRSEKKQEVLTWRNALLRQIKGYNDNNFNLAKLNVIDSTNNYFKTSSGKCL